ncbi:MAG: YggS family pyridoxal phosphate-dependent enzyme [Porphyromonadaceae bacterium]|nr:YggS family pyridoxal phosphate-dependent enzyme [Porphyromonadaceae bacterium]
MELNSSDTIPSRLEAVKATLGEGVHLVAVSKFHPAEVIIEAYEAGQRIFGESRVQELVAKHDILSAIYLDLQWHFIGPLQSNKVKYIAPFVHMIESVDSLKLLREINKQALKHQRAISVLLEVHIAREDSKNGFDVDELQEVLELIHNNPQDFEGIKICGLMAMASNTDDEKLIREEFASIQTLFEQIKTSGLLHEPDEFEELSIGMSGDYKIAMEYGATLVRIGSAIFGDRV